MLRHVLVVVVVLVGCVLPAAPRPASAQAAPPAAAADSVVELRLKDGTVFVGTIVEESDTRVVLVTSSGARVEIPRAQIARIRGVSVRPSGEHWPDDPNHTRLFFTSTARPLEKGEGYISSFMLFFPFVAYGVTDRLTLAGGTPILPGAIGKVFYVAPKYTLVNRDRASFAVGALGIFATESVDAGSVGILYGAGTLGSRDNAVTLGAGWGYWAFDGESGLSNDPVIMIGAERRVSRRVKLVTENWVGFGGSSAAGLVSGGFRFIGDRLSADLGFGGALGESNTCCIPLVNFVYSFGGTNR